MAKGTDETIEDNDDPSHCNFFQAHTCKYVDATFKPPSTTHSIGCDFPECGRWFHESCRGLKFSSDMERQRYAFVCKSHDNISGLNMFSAYVTASVSDKSMQVEDEELIEGSVEDMTVRLLKEVLDDLNISYRSNEKKADLIEKVRRARATLHDASHDHNMRGHAFFSLCKVLEY